MRRERGEGGREGGREGERGREGGREGGRERVREGGRGREGGKRKGEGSKESKILYSRSQILNNTHQLISPDEVMIRESSRKRQEER